VVYQVAGKATVGEMVFAWSAAGWVVGRLLGLDTADYLVIGAPVPHLLAAQVLIVVVISAGGPG
jgi:spore germination protein GerM